MSNIIITLLNISWEFLSWDCYESWVKEDMEAYGSMISEITIQKTLLRGL
jgi:hypothetical protein